MNLISPFSRSTRRAAGQRGSAVILAIATIVMMVLLGAAYLQIARTDRRTAASVDTRSEIDDASILRFIGQIIASDIPTSVRERSVENYDYPWTQAANITDQGMNGQLSQADREARNLRVVQDRFAPTTVPGPVPNLNPGASGVPDASARAPRDVNPVADAAGNFYAAGSGIDDAWLASNRPVNNGGTLEWPHVTNLLGVFLDLRQANLVPDPATGSGQYPAQYLSTSDPGVTNAGLSGDTFEVPAEATSTANEGVFADADGDGITDSRWTWAPLPTSAGLAHVMAVRIIDNSALLDINALSARRSDFGTEPPRWLWPGELDLESGLEVIRTNAGLGAATTTNLSAENILTSAGPEGRNVTGTPGFDTFSGRLYNWLEASALNTDADVLEGWEFLGSDIEQDEAEMPASTPLMTVTADVTQDPNVDYTTYRVRQEETELRWRNGLNRANSDNTASEAPTALETVDNAFFRSPTGAAVEQAFVDTPFATPATFLNDEPRKQITTVSGSADYAREDVNQLTRVRDRRNNSLNANEDLDDLAEVFEESFEDGNQPELFTRGGWASPQNFADQAAAILRDFADDDSLVTLRNGVFGMEYLPFISEVYLQARYTAQGLTAFPAPDPEPRDELAWQLEDNDYVVIIELVNPWPWTIELADVDMVLVDGSTATPTETSLGELQTLAGNPMTFLGPNEAIFVRLEGTSASGDNLGIALPLNPVVFDSTSTTPWPVDAGTNQSFDNIGNLSIRLDAMVNDGSRVTYQQFAVKQLPMDVIESYTFGNGPMVSLGDDGFLQISSLGSADGLDAMAVRAADVEFRGWANDTNFLPTADNLIQAGNVLPLNDPSATATPLPDASTLNFALKNAMSRDTGDPLDERVEDARVSTLAMPAAAITAGDEPWVIGNAGRLYRSGDVLRMVLLGPRDVTGDGEIDPIAEVWNRTFVNNSPGSAYRITDLMLDVNDTANTVGDSDLTFAAYYLTVFETIQLSDDSDRGRVAGRPNINTMDPELLAAILPLINPADSTTLVDFIAMARDNPTLLGRPAAERGIRFPAELLNATNGGNRSLVFDTAVASTVADTNELDPHVGIGVAQNADGFTGDLEEQGMLLNYLNQVVSTRSDVFTVYVVVRSYPQDDFSNDGTGDPVDEFRLMAVFDRSRTNQNGFPRLLSVKKLDE